MHDAEIINKVFIVLVGITMVAMLFWFDSDGRKD